MTKIKEIETTSDRIDAYTKYTPSMLVAIATQMVEDQITSLEFNAREDYGSAYLAVTEYRLETEEEAEARLVKEKEDREKTLITDLTP